MIRQSPNRREFLQATTAGLTTAALTQQAEAKHALQSEVNSGGIPRVPWARPGRRSVCCALEVIPARTLRFSLRRRVSD
jgi:hypothetical protein